MTPAKTVLARVKNVVFGGVAVPLAIAVLAALPTQAQTLTVSVRPSVTPVAGTVGPAMTFAVTNLPYTVTLTATNSNPAYAFDYWVLLTTNVVLDPGVDQDTNSPTVMIVVNSTNVTPLIRAQYKSMGSAVVISASPAAGGYTDPALGTNYMPVGSYIFTATPSNNYEFTTWGGALVGSANPQALFVNTNKTIIANFLRTWTVSQYYWSGPLVVGPYTGVQARNGSNVTVSVSAPEIPSGSYSRYRCNGYTNGVNVTPSSMTGGSVTTCSIQPINNDVSLYWTWVSQWAVDVAPNTNGSAIVTEPAPGDGQPNDRWFDNGVTVTITMSANDPTAMSPDYCLINGVKYLPNPANGQITGVTITGYTLIQPFFRAKAGDVLPSWFISAWGLVTGAAGNGPNDDPDHDGLSNMQEAMYSNTNKGWFFNPFNADTDSDGMDDGYEYNSIDPTNVTDQAALTYRRAATDSGSYLVDNGPEGNPDGDYHWDTTTGYEDKSHPLINREEYQGPDGFGPIFTNLNFGETKCGIAYPFPDNPSGSRPEVWVLVTNQFYTGDTGDQSKGNFSDTDKDKLDDGFEWSWDKWQQSVGGSDEIMQIGVVNGVAIYVTNTVPVWDGSTNVTRRFNPGLNQNYSSSGLVSGQSDNDVLYDYTSGGVSKTYYTDLMEYNASSNNIFTPTVAAAPHSIRMDDPPAGDSAPRRCTHPFLMDVDQDGLPDGYEVIFGYDPWNAHTLGTQDSDGQDNPDRDWMARLSTNALALRNYEVYAATGFDCRVAVDQFYPTANQMPGSGSHPSPFTQPFDNLSEIWGPDGVMMLTPRGFASADDATNPRDPDSDHDGIWDGWEAYVGLNPNSGSDAGADSDGDHLTNLGEFQSFYTSSTNRNALTPLTNWMNKIFPTDPGVAPSVVNNDPLVWPYTADGADTDGDGINDGPEMTYMNGTTLFTNQVVGSWAGSCYIGGGLNPCSSDTDADTMPDPYEASYLAGIDPTVADQFEDADHDKVPNYLEYFSAANWMYQWDVWPAHPTNSWYNTADFFVGTPISFDWSQRFYIPFFGPGPSVYAYVGANPTLADTDWDGMDDYYEIFHMLNPTYGLINLVYSRAARFPVDTASPLPLGYPPDPWVADPRAWPFVNGTPFMDSDGDGLPNSTEGINYITPASAPHYHTDPSPGWMSDLEYVNSWPNEYYYIDPVFSIWYWSGTLPPPLYAFDFEQNEGYDTDNDGFADQEELVTTQTDPLNPERPMKRRSLYLPEGARAYARTQPVVPVITNDALRSYTVEAWVRPSTPVSGTNQVVLERSSLVPMGNPDLLNTDPGLRANFRLGIDESGVPFVGYHGAGQQRIYYEAKAGANVRLSTTNWAHLAGTYQVASPTDPSQRGVLTLYVNGQIAKQTNPDELPWNGEFGSGTTRGVLPSCITVGASDANPNGVIDAPVYPQPQPVEFFKGWIDEVRVWNGARSQAQIQAGMTRQMKQADVLAAVSSSTPLYYIYTFDALGDPDHSATAPAPVGFDFTMTRIIPDDWPYVSFWGLSPEHSSLYSDYRYLPWVQNAVEHLPKLPPTDIGDPLALVISSNATAVATNVVFRNNSDPYGWWHQTAPTRVEEIFHGTPDLLPLGAAQADEDIPMWDNGGTPALDPFSTLGDGIPDAWKEKYGFDPYDTAVADGDADGDGLSNYYEYLCGTDPKSTISGANNLPDTELDADGDGLSNIQELQHGTMPNQKDTDDDGLTDWEEVAGRVDPTWTRPATSPLPKVQTDPLNPLSPTIQRSVYLNGAARLIVPPSDKLVSKDFTVESWVNPDTNSMGGVVVCRYVKGFNAGDYGINYELGLTTNSAPAGKLRPYIRYVVTTNGIPIQVVVDGTGATEVTNGLQGVLVTTGSWSYVAGTCNSASNTLSLYVNGKLASYRTDLITLPPTVYGYGSGHHDDEVTIGALRTQGAVSNGFKGYLDNVRIWSTARDATNILNRYNAPEGIPSSATSLPLKSGTITTLGGLSAQVAALAATAPARILVRFADEASAQDATSLSAAGIQVLNYVTPGVRAVKATQAQLNALGNKVLWTGLLGVENKVSPLVNTGSVAGSRYVLVTFFKDVAQADAVAAVQSVGGAVYNGRYIAAQDLVANLTDAQITALAANNAVSWIAPAASFLTSGVTIHRMADHLVGGAEVAPFVNRGNGWDGPGRGSANLTYHFVNYNCNLPQATAKRAVVDAMLQWAQYAALTFTETATAGLPYSMDIDWEVIDGPLGILGMGYYPNDINPEPIAGDFLLDTQETWKDGMTGAGIDLQYVALHEEGHCLGMAHSIDPSAVMYPYYDGTRGATLAPDDIAGIQNIYGTPVVKSGLAEFRFDDGGINAQDFAVTNDWRTGWDSAAVLDGAVFATNSVAPLDKDTDGDGLPDWWEMANSLSPYDATGVNGAYGDSDGDGLSNLAEYQAGTDPHQWSTAGTTFSDYDSRLNSGIGIGAGTRTYGELYDDGDSIPDLWESQYPGPCPSTGNRGLDPSYYDANLDPDKDGWDNYSEYMGYWLASPLSSNGVSYGSSDNILVKGCDPLNPEKCPQPMVSIRVRYFGKFANNLESILGVSNDVKLAFYHTKTMDGIPDATLNLREDSDGDGLPNWWERMYNLDPASAAGVNGANGDPDNDGWGNIYEFRAATSPWEANNVAELPAGINISGAKTRVFSSGHVRQGPNYVFGFIDLNNNNQWDPLLDGKAFEPAGIAQFEPVNLGWDDVNDIELGLTDDMPGYTRFTWPALANTKQYRVSCSAPAAQWYLNAPTTCFHEGMWLSAGIYGVGTSDSTTYSVYADGTYFTNVVLVSFPRASALVTPTIVTPNGSMAFQYAKNDFQFSVDTNATLYRVQVAATSNGTALATMQGIVPYMDNSGVQKVTLPFYAGDNYVPPAGTYATSKWSNGVYWIRVQGATPSVTSAYSPWSSILVNVQPPSSGGKSMISGDIVYFGKVSHGYGVGQSNNLTIIVQAFQSPGFSGIADGQVQVTYQCNTNAPAVNKGAYSMMGLRNAPYYVRAFIDENGNRQLDPWEPLGFVQTATTNGYVVAPVDLSSGSGNGAKSDVRIVIRDRDTDDDGLPDGWEWMYYGALSVNASNVAVNGLTVLRNYEIEPADLDPTKSDYDADGVPDVVEIDWTDARRSVADNPSHSLVTVDWDSLATNPRHVYNPYDAAHNPAGTDLNPAKWDTDGDGLSDGYEITHGLDPLSAIDGAAQIARARDEGETISGLPSVSRVAVVTPDSGQFALTWQGKIGMNYEVQYSDDLRVWVSAQDGLRYGEALHSYTDQSPRVTTRFYRVVVR